MDDSMEHDYSADEELTEKILEIRRRRANRKRSANFTTKESKLLMKLAKVYEAQISNKQHTTVAVAIKNRAWEELTKDFNNHMNGETYREVDTLKRRWDNMKCMQQKKLQNSKAEKASESNDDDSDSLFSETSRQNHHNTEDSQKPESTFVESSMKLPADSEDEDQGNENHIDDNNDADVKELIRVHITQDDEELQRTNEPNYPKSPILNGSSLKLDLDNNSNLTQTQKTCLLEEHKLRLRLLREKQELELKIMKNQMQEKHELELKVIRLEHSERLKIMRDEHYKRMKMLELEESVGIVNKL